ncbi:hypothetical protein J2T12_000888 [Paenibacillus anaericanus]|uniref:DUF7674 family protein n=1 Tax=Paenibacillus anaericanus TaxID=170367 RepID=UPI002784C2C9|nr:hypothetical protein [Paenibacillus anaericanus]MDQ0087494.1 hypothetical protein [Paenibacillus anaericanus]
MEYNNVVQIMLEAIPEITPMYEKELDWWDEILPHIVFGDVLSPYIITLLRESNPEQTLEKVFDFLEQMAISSDERVQEVLAVTVLEQLGDDPLILEKARQYMGCETKKMSVEIEKGWGRQ